MNAKLSEVQEELTHIGEKADDLLLRTRKLVSTLVIETRVVQKHMLRIKELLGFEDPKCSICCKGPPDHCVDKCHHTFCKACASRMLCNPPPKMFCLPFSSSCILQNILNNNAITI